MCVRDVQKVKFFNLSVSGYYLFSSVRVYSLGRLPNVFSVITLTWLIINGLGIEPKSTVRFDLYTYVYLLVNLEFCKYPTSLGDQIINKSTNAFNKRIISGDYNYFPPSFIPKSVIQNLCSQPPSLISQPLNVIFSATQWFVLA